MAYVLIILAFVATVIALGRDAAEGKGKALVAGLALLTATGVLIVSLVVEHQRKTAATALQESLDRAETQLSDLRTLSEQQEVTLRVQLDNINALRDENASLSRQLAEAVGEREALSDQVSEARGDLDDVRAANDGLRTELASARAEIDRLTADIAAARAQIASFDTAEAQRFALTQCQQTFAPIHGYESVGHALKTGQRFMAGNLDVAILRENYRLAVESGLGGPRAGHIYGVMQAMRDRYEYVTVDGAEIGLIDPAVLNARVAGIYADIAALGCEMVFEDGNGFVCRCDG